MANLMEMRPGVQVKGGDKAELEENEVYNLNDYEEDGMLPYLPVEHAHNRFSYANCSEIDSDAKSDVSVFKLHSDKLQQRTKSPGDNESGIVLDAHGSRCQHQSECSGVNGVAIGRHAVVSTLLNSGRNGCVVM